MFHTFEEVAEALRVRAQDMDMRLIRDTAEALTFEALGESQVAQTLERGALTPNGMHSSTAARLMLTSTSVFARMASDLTNMPFIVCVGEALTLTELQQERSSALDKIQYYPIVLPVTWPVLKLCIQAAWTLAHRLVHLEQQKALAAQFQYEQSELVSIAAAISSEHNIHRLLDLILEKSRYVTNADAGSIYVVEPADTTAQTPDDPSNLAQLRFMIAQNDSIPVDFKSTSICINRSSVVGAAVLAREAIHVPDLSRLSQENAWGVKHDRRFDMHSGYETRSILAIPLINQMDEVIGVLQLINKKRRRTDTLKTPKDFQENVLPFDEHAITLCKTLASQAGVALENALLYNEMKEVFDGFVDASVQAIEARDPATSGHSRRVATLTIHLARAISRTDSGPYAHIVFSENAEREIEYAGLLHDFGKIGVPEAVLVKEKKLFPWERINIETRFGEILASYKARCLEEAFLKLMTAKSANKTDAMDPAAILCAAHQAFESHEKFIMQCLAQIDAANEPAVMNSDDHSCLVALGDRFYEDAKGQRRPYLTQTELACLQIKKGSLSIEERLEIESHVRHTYEYLCAIPWGRNLKSIPRIAGDHHEKLDGSGYPHHKVANEIPIEAKMMTIADMYGALTAMDRPYKPALSVERALDILNHEVLSGHLDPELFKVFVQGRIYECLNTSR